MQVLRHKYVPLKHYMYTFPRILKNRGNIGDDTDDGFNVGRGSSAQVLSGSARTDAITSLIVTDWN